MSYKTVVRTDVVTGKLRWYRIEKKNMNIRKRVSAIFKINKKKKQRNTDSAIIVTISRDN